MCSRLEGCSVTPQEYSLSRFRDAIIGVACAQTFVLFRNAIKTSCLQKGCIYLHKFIVLSTVAVLVSGQNGNSCDRSEEERARSLA